MAPMSARIVWASLAALAAASACTVEPRILEPLPYDGGTRDATTEDAAPPHRSCLAGEVTCAAGEYCTRDDRCEPIPVSCADSDECAPGYTCASNRCIVPPGACTSANDCPISDVCSPLGWCAPQLVAFSPNVTRCELHEDCGPAGSCSAGICGRCDTGEDCRAGLTCGAEGSCGQVTPCDGDGQCFASNRCDLGVCLRSQVGCTPDPEDDDLVHATALDEAHYLGRSICGEDRDWYTLELASDLGATIVVTSTRGLGDVSARVVTMSGLPVRGAATLVLPGVTQLAVPADPEPRVLAIVVEAGLAGGSYELDVRRVLGLCAGDALDLAGDTDPATAPFVAAGVPLSLSMCNGDSDLVRVELSEGDELSVQANFGATGGDLDLELLDSTGVVLAEGRTDHPSVELVSSGSLDRAQALTVRVTAKRAPTAGEAYSLVLRRSLGARQRACDAPELVLTSSTSSITGTLAGGRDLGAPVLCGYFATPSRHDELVRVDPPSSTSIVSITARQLSGARGSTLALALLPDCESDFDLLACDASARPYRPVTLSHVFTNLEPIYLMLSSEGRAEDVEYQLTAVFEDYAMPANDVCTAATELPGTGESSAATYGARDDAVLLATCGLGAETTGPDRFYRLSLAAGERAAVELRGQEGGVLWLGTDCASLTTTCTVADSIDVAHPASVRLQPSRATNYVVVVDGYGPGSAGRYELRTVREPDLQCFRDADCGGVLRCDDYRCVSPPVNDGCPGTALALDGDLTTVRASTGAARDDFAPSCSAARGGADVVYRVLVPAGTRSLTARITEADWDPVIMIRSPSCANAGDEIGCDDDVRFPDLILPEATVDSPEPGEHTIIVDAYEGSGPFTLEIELQR